MKQSIKIFSIALVLGIASSCQGIYENSSEMASDCKKKTVQISVDDLKSKLEAGGDYYLIDIRQPSDYYTGNIPGSILLSRGVLEFKIDDAGFWAEQYIYPPEKESEIIIYSDNGDFGILAAQALNKLGYTRVFNLEGGYKAYNPNQDPNAKPVTQGAGCGG